MSPLALALSSVSSRVRWIAFETTSGQLVAERSWSDDQSRALSDSLGRELASMKLDLGRVEHVCVLTGPGAFTGLRMGVAFAMGLARGLKVPVIGIPTWDLFERDVFIPTRQQLAKKLSLATCIEEKMEFLHLTAQHDVVIETPQLTSFVVGCAENPEWPSTEDLLRTALARSRATQAAPSNLEIFYGMEPKISGQR